MNPTNDLPLLTSEEAVRKTLFTQMMKHRLKEKKVTYLSWFGCLGLVLVIYLHLSEINLVFFPRPIQWIWMIGTVALTILQLYHHKKGNYYHDEYIYCLNKQTKKE